jgi:hypothetical protein
MISLIQILKEGYKGTGPYEQPSNHKPFMYSKDGFNCSNCKYYANKDGKHICNNEYFEQWYGSEVMDIEDPTKWCSDWFEPKEA